jgi:thioredoxin 2
MATDANGMTPLPSHAAFELMLRPRRPIEDGFFDNYAPWTVVCFSATWCGPCQKLDKRTMVTMSPMVKWYSCDIDENKVTAGYCGLYSVPSFCLLKDGVFLDKKAGASSALDVLNWLRSKGVPMEE